MQQQETLPDIVPTAVLLLEVLLGPSAEIDLITVQVQDPDGRLIAMRSWPAPKQGSESAVLDAAWRTLLLAMPHESFVRP